MGHVAADDPRRFGGAGLAAVLALVVAALVVSSVAAARVPRTTFDSDLERAADVAAEQLQGRIERGVLEADALRGLFVASDQVDAAGFDAFATTVLASGALEGVTALGWAPRVARDDIPDLEAARRADTSAAADAPDFAVRPEVTAPDADVVTLLSPMEENRAALGFDLASNPSRRRAIDQARDTGEVVATEPIVLVQEEGDSAAVILYAAVYDEVRPTTLAARRDAFVGVVSVVLRSADFLGPVVDVPGVTVTLVDRDVVGEDGAVVDPTTGAVDAALLLPPLPDDAPSATRRAIRGPARSWELLVAPSMEPPARLDLGVMAIRLVPVLAVTALFWLLGRSERRALARTRDALDRLGRSERRLADLVASSPDPVLLLDADGTVTFASEAAARLLAPAGDDVVGRRLGELFLAADGSRDDALLAGLEDHERVDVEVRSVTGTGLDVAAVRFQDDQVLLSVRDATARLATVAALERAVDREREAAEAHRDLAASRHALLSTVSHELRTPLAAIVGFSGVLADQLARDGDDDGLPWQCADRIRHNAATLTNQVDDLVAFSRLERDDMQLDLRPADLHDLAVQTVAAIAPALGGRHVEVGGGPAPTTVDQVAVARVVTNLVVNAQRYTPADAPIVVTTTTDGDRSVLVVEDGGPGIPVDERERVFGQFVRGTSGTATSASGTGIGLSVVRGLTEQMGGAVVLDASPLGGARFTIALPRTTAVDDLVGHAPDVVGARRREL